MNYLRTDQYTNLSHDCPVRIDLHTADHVVEIALGEHRFTEDTLRLVIDHPDLCQRLADALLDAGTRLSTHLRAETALSAVGE